VLSRFVPLAFVAAMVALGACGRTRLVTYAPRPIDAGFDAGVDAGFDAGPPCRARELGLTAAVPTVMFVIDRSGSMQDDLAGFADAGTSRWDVLHAALAQVLPPHDQQLAMGAVRFPATTSSSCGVPTSVDLMPKVGNAASILSLFRTPPKGGTPTAEALHVAARALASTQTAANARALVLTTDGAPNCNDLLDPNTCSCTPNTSGVVFPVCPSPSECLDDTRTVTTLSGMFTVQKLPTYVIGLASDQNFFIGTLDQMAIAGGVPRQGAGHPFYAADNAQELTDALTRITAQLAKCTYLVTGGAGPNDAVVVTVGPTLVPNDATGWEWIDENRTELNLHGAACDLAATGARVEAVVECP
jgi:hypothetical protein